MSKYTTYEVCQAIRNQIVTRVGEALVYNWSSDFQLEHIRGVTDVVEKWQSQTDKLMICPADMTTEEMDNLDFGIMNTGDSTRLIPIWLYPFLADEFSNGTGRTMKKKEIDTDHRGGCLWAYVTPTDAK